MTRNQKVVLSLAALGGLAGVAALTLAPKKAKAKSPAPTPAPVPEPSEQEPSGGGGSGESGAKLLSDADYDFAYDKLETLGYAPVRAHFKKVDEQVRKFQQDVNKVHAAQNEAGAMLRNAVSAPLTEDGILGPKTLDAIKAATILAGMGVAGLALNGEFVNIQEAWNRIVQGADVPLQS